MFPNPQEAVPLPPRPDLKQYRKQAKELVKACKSDDKNALDDWAGKWLGFLAQLHEPSIRPWISRRVDAVAGFAERKMADKCTLADAQFVIARSHGFQSWPKFAKHLEAIARGSSATSRFEAASDAIVTGDVPTLERLLREDPELIRARSTREHGATLLHYVSANGVEGYRQKTPQNIVDITEILLKAGAEVDATADVYGGGFTALGLAATSVHPEAAGVQEALLEKLLDYGANIDQPSGGGRGESIIRSCLANGRPKAAEFLASRGAQLDFVGAAALGHLDTVQTSSPSDHELQAGFRHACGYGRKSVVEFLLDKGVDLAAHGGDGQTPLHWAVVGGQLEVVKLLLRHNPPLDAVNMYGGKVLGQALWSAAHGGDADLYIAILEALVAAGATIPERHVPVNTRVDAWLAQHGSRPEPSWHWYGEGPARATR
jgi:ankyrin repeat protein